MGGEGGGTGCCDSKASSLTDSGAEEARPPGSWNCMAQWCLHAASWVCRHKVGSCQRQVSRTPSWVARVSCASSTVMGQWALPLAAVTELENSFSFCRWQAQHGHHRALPLGVGTWPANEKQKGAGGPRPAAGLLSCQLQPPTQAWQARGPVFRGSAVCFLLPQERI